MQSSYQSKKIKLNRKFNELNSAYLDKFRCIAYCKMEFQNAELLLTKK